MDTNNKAVLGAAAIGTLGVALSAAAIYLRAGSTTLDQSTPRELSETKASNEFTVLSEEEVVAEHLHIGVEMGGTSCKIGIFRNSDGAKTELTKLCMQSFITS